MTSNERPWGVHRCSPKPSTSDRGHICVFVFVFGTAMLGTASSSFLVGWPEDVKFPNNTTFSTSSSLRIGNAQVVCSVVGSPKTRRPGYSISLCVPLYWRRSQPVNSPSDTNRALSPGWQRMHFGKSGPCAPEMRRVGASWGEAAHEHANALFGSKC